ncbi:DDE-type integrase/transposase/recombinase, partial [Candidatus Megaera venefica]|uniref:DDE-type integrase/transposase/recombinase n=1 Tax=Candidatus Megaera venefica TaxID=2055910 RepID=UPI002AD56287
MQAYSVELAKRIRYYSKPYSTSWQVDETYIKVKGKWKYLYRVLDKYGSTIDFMLSSHRDIAAAKKFFK